MMSLIQVLITCVAAVHRAQSNVSYVKLRVLKNDAEKLRKDIFDRILSINGADGKLELHEAGECR